MPKSTISFVGSLVKKPELRTSSNDKKFTFLSLARNYVVKNDETGEWEQKGTIFQDVTLFGKVAENFVDADLALGTRVFVSGSLNYVPESRGTAKDGSERIFAAKESIIADVVALPFDSGQKPVVEKTEGSSTPKPKRTSDDDGFDPYPQSTSDDDGEDWFKDL